MSDTNQPRRPRRTVSVTTLLRQANSNAASRYGIGGRLKSRHKPRAITMPTILCLARPPDEDGKP